MDFATDSAMGSARDPAVAAREARLYDHQVADWPAELDFYRTHAAAAHAAGHAVLEIGCGTGRIALRLAEGGMQVMGLEHSAEMLAVARAKATGLAIYGVGIRTHHRAAQRPAQPCQNRGLQ